MYKLGKTGGGFYMRTDRIARKLSYLVAVPLFALAISLSGCNQTSTPQGKTSSIRSLDRQQNPSVAPDQTGDVISRGTRWADRDRIMGRNQNPNLIIGHQNVINKDVDMRSMVAAAKNVPGVENARITLHGGNAYVTLDLVHNVTAGQARYIEDQVISALKLKAPRYDYHITSHDGYHR
jgi:hypothetical protein